jgi:CDP-glucose 4,6-dehydratase
MADRRFWEGRRVFVTGHTGFKGSWLCLHLQSLGAKVAGYALAPPTDPSLYDLCRVGELVDSVEADIREAARLRREMSAADPEVVFHLAAQPLVRDSYQRPAETYEVNVLGTVNLLEAVRACPRVRSVVVVTTDKCYENREWVWGYRETDRLGGHDPYASSKACAELAAASWTASFFPAAEHSRHGVALATARSGNVIGGGDWAADRIVPDFVRAALAGRPLLVRAPRSVRPWQHVLDPLEGYLLLARRLHEDGPRFAGAWNFGPDERDIRSVEELVGKLAAAWGTGAGWEADTGAHPHETALLKLDSSKARSLLGWRPRWDIDAAVGKVVEWSRSYRDGLDLRQICLDQIRAHEAAG